MQSLSERGNDLIPVTTYDRIKNNGGKFPEGVADKIRKRGVVVVRDTVPADEAQQMVGDLLKYMYDNNVYPGKENQASLGQNIQINKNSKNKFAEIE